MSASKRQDRPEQSQSLLAEEFAVRALGGGR